MGKDPDIKHRYQLIVKAFGTFEELCKIKADICCKSSKPFGQKLDFTKRYFPLD
jgi:hypothetical protein